MVCSMEVEFMNDENNEMTKEEDELIGRNIKEMQQNILDKSKEDKLQESEVRTWPLVDEVQQRPISDDQLRIKWNASNRSQISYRDKLLGEEATRMDKDFEERMTEWLREEEELTPILTDEQRVMLASIPALKLSNEKLKQLCKPWRNALILTVLGKRTNLHMMKDRLRWLLRSENFELIDLPNNYYIFRTEDNGLRTKILFDGPWLIQGHYLAVQTWSPNFNPHSNRVRKVAVWIRIPTLPLHMYSEDCLFDIGNLIGRTLKVDLNTLAYQGNEKKAVERGKYARVSVEIDLNKKLQSRFVLRNHIYPVEYEGLNVICFQCGIYGHTMDKCSISPQNNQEAVEQSTPGKLPASRSDKQKEEALPLMSVPGVTLEDEYGEWMQAKLKSRPRQSSLDLKKKG